MKVFVPTFEEMDIELPDRQTIIKDIQRAWTVEGINSILEAKRLIIEFIDEHAIPEWIDLKRVLEMKGLFPSAVRKQYMHLWPPIEEAREVGDQRMWHKSVIKNWMRKDDEGREHGFIG